jgi:hypothetical protein
LNTNDVMQQFMDDVYKAVVDVSSDLPQPQSDELIDKMHGIARKYGVSIGVIPPRVTRLDPQPEGTNDFNLHS